MKQSSLFLALLLLFSLVAFGGSVALAGGQGPPEVCSLFVGEGDTEDAQGWISCGEVVEEDGLSAVSGGFCPAGSGAYEFGRLGARVKLWDEASVRSATEGTQLAVSSGCNTSVSVLSVSSQ